MAQPLSDSDKQEALKAVEENGTVIRAAKAIGVNASTLQSRYRAARDELSEEDRLAHEQRKSKPERDSPVSAWDELDFWKKRCAEAERDASMAARIREEVFGLVNTPLDLPKWSATKRKKKLSDIPVLFTSDFQYGEKVSPGEINGLNAYDTDIAKKRYRELIGSTIDICWNHRRQEEYPGIFYLRGGDAISGDIHDELKETNEVTSIVQIKDIAKLEAWGIERLAEQFGKVHVISVCGNHGRTTKKPRAKGYTETNFEYLSASLLEWYFDKDPRITFTTPLAGDVLFDVYSTKFMMTHGDMIGSSGGQGFIGPAATIMRGLKKTRDQYASMNRHFDFMLIGHFHVAMQLPHCIVNGALVGPSEYSVQKLRAEPERPSQTLFFVNPKWGVTEVKTIYLEEPGAVW